MTEKTLIEQLAENINNLYAEHFCGCDLADEVKAKLEAAFREMLQKESFDKTSDEELTKSLIGFTQVGCWYVGYDYAFSQINKQAGITLTEEKNEIQICARIIDN